MARKMWSTGKKFPARGPRNTAASPSTPCTTLPKATLAVDMSSYSTPSSNGTPHCRPEDSPYLQAKHVQMVDKDPQKSIPLFWAAINSGDRVDSALKDMAFSMKQMNRAEEAIEAIKSFRHLCSPQSQESIDNVLLELCKKCGRIEDQIDLLNLKLKMINEGLAFGGRKTKLTRYKGKKIHVSLEQEKSRVLGNLAWVYMQSGNYKEAESLYRKALAIEQDYNKQCNLAICLIKTGRLEEAKSILQCIQSASTETCDDFSLKSLERASQVLMELESQSHAFVDNEMQHNISEERTPTGSSNRTLVVSENSLKTQLIKKCKRNIWAEMVEEEQSAIQDFCIDVTATGTVAVASENDLRTQLIKKSKRNTWVDMVEEEEQFAIQKLSIPVIGNNKNVDISENCPRTQLQKSERRTWADMVEEEESLTVGSCSHRKPAGKTIESSRDSSEAYFRIPSLLDHTRSGLSEFPKAEGSYPDESPINDSADHSAPSVRRALLFDPEPTSVL